MPIIRHKKRGEQTYAYEETSYWDSEKQQGRKHLKYLGKVNRETGGIIPPKRKFNSIPKQSCSYGGVEFLRRLSKRLGLTSILKKIYLDDHEDILSLAYFKLLSGEPFYLFPDWLEENEIKANVGSSQSISKLLAYLGQRSEKIEEFFSLWTQHIKEVESIFFDITSISTYSRKIDVAENGYNRDKENLKQFNIGLISSKSSGAPLAYRVYPGSINDVSTLRNAILLFSQLKLRASLFVMDRGFYSDQNLIDCARGKVKVLIPLPFRNSSAFSLLERSSDVLNSVHSAFRYSDKKNYFYCKDSLKIGGYKFHAHIYLDPIIRAEKMSKFLIKIEDFEERFVGKTFDNVDEVKTYIKQSVGLNYFTVYEKSNRFEIVRNEAEINKKILQMGVMILLSSQKLNQTQVLDYYRGKDDVEKIFNDLKNPLKEDRMRCKNQETLDGKIFLLFITLILYSHIKKIAKEKGLLKQFTIPQILKELQKLKTFHLHDGQKILSELTKKQKTIFSAFGFRVAYLKT